MSDKADSLAKLRTELAETKQRLAMLEDRSLDAIVAIDQSAVIRRWNPAAQRIFGWSVTEAKGSSFFDLLIPEDQRTSYIVGLQRDLETGTPRLLNRRVESPAQHRDCQRITIELSVAPHESDQGLEFVAVIRDITERQQSIASLQDAYDRYQDWYENSPDFFATVNAGTGVVESCNTTLAEAIGRPKNEIVGHSVFDLYAPESIDTAKATLAKFLAKGLIRNTERKLVRADGSVIDVILNASPVHNTHGEIIASRSVWRDISARKLAQQKIEDREARIAALLQSTAEGIYGLDGDGNCTFANPACAKLLGYDDAKELHGRNMHDLIHHTRPDGTRYPRDQCHIGTAYREGKKVHIDDEVLWRKDGTSFSAEYWAYPVKFHDHETGAVVTFLDITERKELEIAQTLLNEELEELVVERTTDLDSTRQRLELALVSANIGLWDWNAETDDVYFSATYKEQIGFPENEPWRHFRDWEGRLHPDDRDGALERVNRHFADPSSEYRSSFRMKCRDGSYRWFLAQGKATLDDDGKPLRMLGVHIDVTQRMEDEKELLRLNQALEGANEALRQSNVELQQFAYVASHDLQTPLRAISGFAQFLKKDYEGKLDETADDFIERIVNGTKRMQKMIDDLLEFSRVESRAASFKPVDLNEAFADAIGLLNVAIAELGAEVTSGSLPTVLGDQSQLVKLFQNLIGNSLKYCNEKPAIHASADRQRDQFVIAVKDNGIGIAPKQHEKIFEVFRRLHGHGTYSGNGIGLAVCRRIVLRHGGEIWVESQEGAGSTFRFSLPIT